MKVIVNAQSKAKSKAKVQAKAKVQTQTKAGARARAKVQTRTMAITIANIFIFVILMSLIMIFTGCVSDSGKTSSTPGGSNASTGTGAESVVAEKSKYYFDFNGTPIYMNDKAKPVLDALGKPMHYFESPSCAFQGIDRVYTYNGFELYTYTDGNDETEYILNVIFMNDSVETNEGVTLGNKLDDIISKYGDKCIQDGNKYTFSDGNTNLSFVVTNDEIVDVSYNLIID